MIYRVKPGDTLYEIAQRFDTTVQELTQLNRIDNINYLNTGQVIAIPQEYETDEEAYRFANKIVNGLLLTAFTKKYTYQVGENIIFNLVKVNISNNPITLNYSTTQRFDLATGYGQQRWIWSVGRSFNQEAKEVNLQPGENKIYTAVWDQKDNKDRQVDTGYHSVEVWNVANEIVNERLDLSIKIE